jgi:CRP-like cAMP-binding protein
VYHLFFSYAGAAMDSKETLKQHIAKTISVSDDQFDFIFSHFKPQVFRKGQTIFAAGDNIDCEFFVVRGCLKTFYINDDLKMFTLQIAMPTWWASDYNALYTGVKATVSLDCITDSEVLCLKAEDREKLCQEIHAIEHFFRWRTNMGYVTAQKQLLSIIKLM